MKDITISNYDHYIVAFSGGKDSTACFLWLLDQGVDRSKIELWHQEIDGREGSTMMDWECTPDYCRKFAAAFDVPIYYSWKVGGFEGEFLRENSRTAPNKFETPDGQVVQVGGHLGKENTRKMFPQVSADLSVRWCSPYLKMDVSKVAINNQDRFLNKRILYISGERGEESAARDKYDDFQLHGTDNRKGIKRVRHVDHIRPILRWKENEVWDIIKKYKIRVHPAYYLGFGRVSCKWCIFADANQLATTYSFSPKQGDKIIAYESMSGKTIKRKKSIRELIDEGQVYSEMDKNTIDISISKEYTESIFIEGIWTYPKGAFKHSCGPT